MIPTSHIGKTIFVLWSLVCIGLLLFAYLQRNVDEMPIAFTWLMIFVSAPVSFIVAPITGITTTFISELANFKYNPFLSLLPSWLIMVIVGYIQWFVVMPRLFKWALKRVKHLTRNKSTPTAGRS